MLQGMLRKTSLVHSPQTLQPGRGDAYAHNSNDRGSEDSLEVQALGIRRRESLKAELVCFIQVLSPLAAIFKHSIPWLAESAFLDVEGHWAELSLSLLLASKGRCPRHWTRTRPNGSDFPT